MLSFSRQLLSYGFIRITDCRTSKEASENNFAAFYHPNFKRGCIEDVRNIKKIDKNRSRKHDSKFVYMDPFKPARMKKKKDNNLEKQ
ncbi:hypothetical protein CONCODRAFT_20985 [Conidiobolus coronatus NRRL 28638]|uniref:HSF-type DNA-binding domain-containing protein n=1 Tax=Conidiobolus coronatus (strain ATCC 28846 / CBS 209.66 / NRRL 28638) TaxID=796925 RepID=A0A137NQ56_CONC2|nr:hypothetical protein CONCODRAFT_20985 [Conidiobolus coronatus NRRL 28638]|eukprot:KXN64871.1 hypothetical protein CONCODRAFT_20985 [Conidiobolus coronatus NRRL 28638]